MKKWLAMGLILLLLTACTQPEPALAETPSVPIPDDTAVQEMPGGEVPDAPETEEITASGRISLYASNEDATALRVEFIDAEHATPQMVVDELVRRGVQPEGLKVIEFAVERERVGSLKVSEEFKDALSSTGTTGELILCATICYTFLDTFGLDELSFTCEGAPFETGHTYFQGNHAGFGYMMGVETDLYAYLHEAEEQRLFYDDAQLIYSWEEEEKAAWADYLQTTGQDFSQNYYAVINTCGTQDAAVLAEDVVIRRSFGTNDWKLITREELTEYLKSCENPPLFQIERDEDGAITHLFEVDLDATD